MYKQRLFKRLSFYNENPNARLKTQDIDNELSSIKEHLGRLLLSRVYSSLLSNDYGILDLNNNHDEYFSDFLISLEEEITKVIIKYEKRISEVTVKFIKTDKKHFNLNFEINAILKSDNKTKIKLKTIVYPEGKIFLDEE